MATPHSQMNQRTLYPAEKAEAKARDRADNELVAKISEFESFYSKRVLRDQTTRS